MRSFCPRLCTKASTITIIWWVTVVSQAVAMSNSSSTTPLTTKTIQISLDGCYCQNVKWYDILTFFALNYIAHAMTVRMTPGQSILTTTIDAICAIFFPYGKIHGEIVKISQVPVHRIWREHPLEKAKRAGALCTVEKSTTPVEDSDRDEPWVSRLIRRNIFGQLGSLPDGFKFRTLGSQDNIDTKCDNTSKQPLELPTSSKFLKAGISVGQAGFVIFSLLKASTTCGQLTKFGYVSPVFTILPYAIMSLVNAFSVVITPNYPMQYLISSADMDEAIERGWQFDPRAVVGNLIPTNPQRSDAFLSMSPLNEKPYMPPLERPDSTPSEQKNKGLESVLSHCRLFAAVLGGIACMAAPYILMQVLTHFKTGESTRVQRGVIMGGLVLGQFWALFITVKAILEEWWAGDTGSEQSQAIKASSKAKLEHPPVILVIIGLLLLILMATLGVYSFVIVGQMLRQTGQCIELV